MKIESFSKCNLGDVRDEIEKALETVKEKLGIELKIGNISYNDTFFTAKIKASVITNGVAQSQERSNYEKQAKVYGLRPEWLDMTVKTKTKTYKIVGFNQKKRKFAVVLEDIKTGKKAGITVEYIKSVLEGVTV